MINGWLHPKLWLFSLFLAAILFGAVSCSDGDLQKLQGFAQGTSYHITYWPEAPVNPETIKFAVEAEFERIDRLLSNYRDDSVIELFNQVQNDEAQEVGPEIVSLVRAADKVRLATSGCYDLTIKPLFKLWKFNSEEPSVPAEESIAETLQKVGMQALEIVGDTRLKKNLPGLELDLSSIAQGYSVLAISQVLERKGINNYLVEIGGELKTSGHKPDGKSWRIAVEKPLPGEQMLHKIITMPNESAIAIMTSGTYRHYFDDHGKRYSHILDARTGHPVTHDLVSVTVALEDPILADAWSTALLCLGREQGMQVAEQNNVPALFIEYRDDQLLESKSRPLVVLQSIKIQ